MTYHKNSKKKRVVCAMLAFVLTALPVGNASLAFAAENDSPFPYRIHNTISQSAKPPKAGEWRMEDTASPSDAASPSDSREKATASNAERVTLNVFAEDSFNPGEEAVVNVVIQNKTDEALTQGIVSYSAYGINPEYSSFLGEDRSEEEEMLEYVTVAPHDTYEFQYRFQVPNHEKAKNYWISFCLNAWKGDAIVRSTENFLYNVGVMRIGTIDFPEGNEIVAGDEMKMDIYLEDFFMEMEEKDGGEEIGTPSRARRPSKQKATSSNAGADGKVKYTVEFKGLAIEDILFRSLNEDDKSDRTEMEAVFKTETDCEPGTYYGVVTAEVKRGRTTYQSTQAMAIEVARPDLTAEINGVEIRIASPSEAFPIGKNLTLEVTELPREEGTPEKDLLDSAVSASSGSSEAGESVRSNDTEEIPAAISVDEYRMFDIKVLSDGEEVEPEGPVQVSFTGIVPEEKKAEKVEVYHIDTEARQTEQMPTEVNESGNVVMETTHFSVYAVVLPSDDKGPYKVQFRHMVKDDKGIYSEYYRRGETTVGDLGNHTAIIGVTDFCKTGYDVDKINVYKMDQAGEKTGESIKSLDQTKNIEIRQNTVVEIYYKEAAASKEVFPVTYYDYDVVFTGDSVGGINHKDNYVSSRTNQRLMVGTKSWVPKTTTSGKYNYEFGSYGTYSVPMSGGLDADENNAPPNGMDGNTPYGGTPIVQGIIKSLGDDGNPVFGKTSNSKPIVDPGLFTDVEKKGKKIYSAKEGQFSLVFKKQGEKYVLDSSVNNKTKKVTSANTNNQFFPLDDVESAQMFPNNEAENNGRENNWYFGMRFETTFTIGDYIGPLNFTFSGDDDMWVFIDNELVLDLGGMHSAYPNVYAEHGRPTDIKNSVNLWSYLNGNSKYDENAEYNPSKTYGEKHKLTVLYMERGGFDSNCRIEFAIPLDETPQYHYRSTVDIPVQKVWDDKDNAFGSRPDQVEVQLYCDGNPVPGKIEVLNSLNGWQAEWKDLPKYARDEEDWDIVDQPHKYTVQEVNVPKDYTVTYTEAEDSTLIVTNTWREGKIEGKLDISKRIDWLGDGVENADTALNGAGDYRLYLNVSGKMNPPVDLILVLDKSGSMNDSNRIKELGTVLLGTDNSKDGFLYKFLRANPNNKISVVSFSRNSTNKDKWLTDADAMSSWIESSDEDETIISRLNEIKKAIPTKGEKGTNYGAGLYKAHELLNKASGDKNRKYMLFLSDGVPTFYLANKNDKTKYPINFTDEEAAQMRRYGNGEDEDSNNKACLQPNLKMVENFKNIHPELTIYSVGFDTDDATVLKTLGDKYLAANSKDINTLDDAFGEMLLGPNQVMIKDQLSKYVDFADRVNWKITETNSLTGNTKLVLEQDPDQKNDGSIIQNVNLTNDTITVTFNPTFNISVFSDYTLSFDVKVNDEAYKQHEDSAYNAKGDNDTDYLPTENATSSEKDGFYSNERAIARYHFIGEDAKEEDFPKPVVQVTGKQVRVKLKKVIDNYGDYEEVLKDDEFMVQANIADRDFESGSVLTHNQTSGWIILDQVGPEGVDIKISEIIPMEYEFAGITVESYATQDDIEGRCRDEDTVHLDPDDGEVVIVVHNNFSHKPFFHGFSKKMNLFSSSPNSKND